MAIVAFVRPEPHFVAEPNELSGRVGHDEARNRLRLYGRAMRLFSIFVFVGWVCLQIGCLLSLFLHFRSGIVTGAIDGTIAFKFWPVLEYFSPSHALRNAFSPRVFPQSMAIGYAIVLTVASVPFCAAFLYLEKLFNLYSQGEVFTQRNTTMMRRVGHSIMATGYSPLLLGPVAHAIGVLKPMTGITDGMIAFVFLGLTVLSISHVVEIGQRMQQDQESIL